MAHQHTSTAKVTRQARAKPPVARRTHSLNEVAEILGIGTRTAWAIVERGELRAVKVGGRTLVPVTELDRILDPERNPMVARDAG